jgi:hypothetical protein
VAGQVHLALLGVLLVVVARFLPDGLLVTGGKLLRRQPPRPGPIPVLAGEPTTAGAGRDE